MSLVDKLTSTVDTTVWWVRQEKIAYVALSLAALAPFCVALRFLFVGEEFRLRADEYSNFDSFFTFDLPLWCLIWAVMAVAWWNRAGECVNRVLHFILPLAALAMLFLAMQQPLFSDDINRYVWEGKVIANGMNPYTFPPDSEELIFLRGTNADLYEAINYPEISAIYPPLPQYLFALLSLTTGEAIVFRLAFMAIFFFAVVPALRKWLALRGAPDGRIFLLLLHPMVFIEIAQNGHLDVLLLAGAAIAFIAVNRTENSKSPEGAAAGLAITVLTKVAPIVLLPHLANHWKRPYKTVILYSVPILVGLMYLPFIGTGWDLFRAFGSYNRVWQSNASVYSIFSELFYRISVTGDWFRGFIAIIGGEPAAQWLFTAPYFGAVNPNDILARVACGGIFGIVWLWLLVRPRPFEEQWLLIMGAGLLLSPVVHPWYLIALLPGLLYSTQYALPIAWWSLMILFNYGHLSEYWQTGEWNELDIVWWIQYGGLIIVTAWTTILYGGEQKKSGSYRDYDARPLR